MKDKRNEEEHEYCIKRFYQYSIRYTVANCVQEEFHFHFPRFYQHSIRSPYSPHNNSHLFLVFWRKIYLPVIASMPSKFSNYTAKPYSVFRPVIHVKIDDGVWNNKSHFHFAHCLVTAKFDINIAYSIRIYSLEFHRFSEYRIW